MARDINGSLRVPYLNYKKDTRYILWWLAHASNSIIAAVPGGQRAVTDIINTSGHITCSEIKIMSKRVAAAFHERGEQVLSTIPTRSLCVSSADVASSKAVRRACE